MKYNELIELIDSTYGKFPYSLLCKKHIAIIEQLSELWIPFSKTKPELNSHVFCIQDLSPYGRGIFIEEDWYNEHGFVSYSDHKDSDDTYGHITHWFYKSTLES